MSNKLMIFRSNRKNGRILPFDRKRSYLKRIRGYDPGKEGGKSLSLEARGTLLVSNNEKNVFAENALSYF